jgi:tetratricopeptide (TPR) repeat protein
LIIPDEQEAAAVTGNEDAEIWLRKGFKAEKAEHWDEAMDCYQTARLLNPRNARALVMLGSLFLGTGRDQEAVAMFDEAARLNDPQTNALLAQMFPA